MAKAFQPREPDPLMAVWIAIALMVGALIGIAAGAITAWGGGTASKSVLTGGGAFATAATLLILIITTIRKR
jgi:hypothetical protein